MRVIVIRCCWIFGAVGCLAAVLMGRISGPTVEARSGDRVKFVNFPLADTPFSEPDPRFVDVETGRESRMDVPEGDALDLIAVAPWRDERGVGQVAGRWSSRSGSEVGLVLHEFGLARYTFPGGKPLNRVPTEITPTGRLCWLPGGARVLFAAGDGMLYRFGFEGSAEPDASRDGCDTRPHRLLWKVAPPGEGEGHSLMTDPYRPEGCGFGGRLLASLSYQVSDEGKARFTPPQLWWLQLDRDATAITALGPFTGGQGDVRERNPTLVKTASGQVRVAYLERASDRDPWRIVVARVDFEGGAEPRPLVDRAGAKVVAEDCEATNLAFSADGRWLYYGPNKGLSRLVRRVPVPDLDGEGRQAGAIVAMTRAGL